MSPGGGVCVFGVGVVLVFSFFFGFLKAKRYFSLSLLLRFFSPSFLWLPRGDDDFGDFVIGINWGVIQWELKMYIYLSILFKTSTKIFRVFTRNLLFIWLNGSNRIATKRWELFFVWWTWTRTISYVNYSSRSWPNSGNKIQLSQDIL